MIFMNESQGLLKEKREGYLYSFSATSYEAEVIIDNRHVVMMICYEVREEKFEVRGDSVLFAPQVI